MYSLLYDWVSIFWSVYINGFCKGSEVLTRSVQIKGIIKKLAKFIGKHLYQRFFLRVRARALEVKLIHAIGTHQIKKQSSGGVLLKRCS